MEVLSCACRLSVSSISHAKSIFLGATNNAIIDRLVLKMFNACLLKSFNHIPPGVGGGGGSAVPISTFENFLDV